MESDSLIVNSAWVCFQKIIQGPQKICRNCPPTNYATKWFKNNLLSLNHIILAKSYVCLPGRNCVTFGDLLMSNRKILGRFIHNRSSCSTLSRTIIYPLKSYSTIPKGKDRPPLPMGSCFPQIKGWQQKNHHLVVYFLRGFDFWASKQINNK